VSTAWRKGGFVPNPTKHYVGSASAFFILPKNNIRYTDTTGTIKERGRNKRQ